MIPDPDNTELLDTASILIVDDDPVSRKFICKTLLHHGFSNVYAVDNAVKALAHMENSLPDMVILDISMPGMNGLECCATIRKIPHGRMLPVLMLTALTDEIMRVKAFHAGATDFVSKPLHAEELYARVRVHLLNQLIIKQLCIYKERLQIELDGAKDLQRAILPTQSELKRFEDDCGLEISSYLKSSSEIGGDFWGIKKIFPHQSAFWIADFSGHGVAAAMNAFRLQTYLHEHSELMTRPGEYLSHLNEKLLIHLLRGHFATMLYGIIDMRGNQLHYATGCNPHPLVLRHDGTVEKIEGSGMPLGIQIQYYDTHSIPFEIGDTIVLYSDALIESRTTEGHFINDADLMELLNGCQNLSACDLKNRILTYFYERVKTAINDDLTLCIINRQMP